MRSGRHAVMRALLGFGHRDPDGCTDLCRPGHPPEGRVLRRNACAYELVNWYAYIFGNHHR